MNKPVWLLPLLLPFAGAATAQNAGVACPYLAADTGLTWEYRDSGDTDLCRALRADGSEAFGLMIAREAPFKPKGGNRAERVVIDGRKVTWYRTEIAGTDIEARETLVELPDGRVAYIWVQARSPEQLDLALQHTGTMKFGTARLSSK